MRKFFNVFVLMTIILSFTNQTTLFSAPAPTYKLYKHHSLGKTTDLVFYSAIRKAAKGDFTEWNKTFECPFPQYIKLVKKEVIAGLDSFPEIRDANFPVITDDTIVSMLLNSILIHHSYPKGERLWRLTSDNKDDWFPAKEDFTALVFVYNFTDRNTGNKMQMDLIVFECFNPKKVNIWELPASYSYVNNVNCPQCPQCKDSIITKYVIVKDSTAFNYANNNQNYVYHNIWGQYIPYTPYYRVEGYYCIRINTPMYYELYNTGCRPLFYSGCRQEFCYFERNKGNCYNQQCESYCPKFYGPPRENPQQCFFDPQQPPYNPPHNYTPRPDPYQPRDPNYTPRETAYNPRNPVYTERPNPYTEKPNPYDGKPRPYDPRENVYTPRDDRPPGGGPIYHNPNGSQQGNVYSPRNGVYTPRNDGTPPPQPMQQRSSPPDKFTVRPR